jgi:hypothetical protein
MPSDPGVVDLMSLPGTTIWCERRMPCGAERQMEEES